jgi:hypothetical protein
MESNYSRIKKKNQAIADQNDTTNSDTTTSNSSRSRIGISLLLLLTMHMITVILPALIVLLL